MELSNKRKSIVVMTLFLVVELVLYILILTIHGPWLTVCLYSSIILCFLYALSNCNKDNALIIGGLGFTLAADFCLVVCSPIEQLWGMVFFLGAQILYAVKLQLHTKNKILIFVRFCHIILAEIVAVVFLGEKTDALAVISLCYYVNLFVNIIAAFARFNENKFLSVGLLLFILCDTVIGLQVASGTYLPISENSLIYKIIFGEFYLSWFFYLPSQVLISLSSRVQAKQRIKVKITEVG